MFFLSILFLVLASGLIHRVGMDPANVTPLEEQIIARSMLAIWPMFLIEGVVRLIVCRGQGSRLQRIFGLLIVCLFPPSRVALRACSDPNRLWLPWFGWRHVDRHLRRQLDRFFSVPMILVALLVLPVVCAEYFWADRIRDHFGLGLMLDIANSVIWGVFTLEFLIMIAVADKKVRYCIQHWMDLAIVVLPLIDFLPIFRLLRLTRLMQAQQLTRMGRLYRIRGLLMKLWRAVLLLDMLQKLLGNRPEKRLAQLRELLAAKEEEVADLRKEISDFERQIAMTRKPTHPGP